MEWPTSQVVLFSPLPLLTTKFSRFFLFHRFLFFFSVQIRVMTRYFQALAGNTSSATATATAPPPEAVAIESDFVVILAALLCALICMVGLIAVARCAWLRRGSNGGGAGNQASANRGLKKKILQSLPKFTYRASGSGGEGKFAAECAICLAEFLDGEEIRQLPQCGHCFHVSCVDTWLSSHSSCPSCRQILVVARCQNCGEFPAVVHGGDHNNEEEQKRREDNNGNNRGLGFLP